MRPSAWPPRPSLHAIHAMSIQISPVEGCTGIELLETDHFDLRCTQTATGTKFFVTAAPKTIGLEHLLRSVYDLYSDYVMKNPFYEMEMPIRCELFDQNVLPAVRNEQRARGTRCRTTSGQKVDVDNSSAVARVTKEMYHAERVAEGAFDARLVSRNASRFCLVSRRAALSLSLRKKPI